MNRRKSGPAKTGSAGPAPTPMRKFVLYKDRRLSIMESCNVFAKSYLRGIGANFVLQSTNAQGLGTRLVHNYVHKVEVHYNGLFLSLAV